jgi:cytochrome o ubiquinol oxidase subunit 2
VGRIRNAILLPAILGLAGCKTVVLHPSGEIAAQERDLLLQSTGLMLLIIVPVMALTALFAWRYRHANRQARYEPDWDHSTQLELVIWGAPLLIIICLGALTWMGTHLLDPYRAVRRVAEQERGPSAQSLEVEVVALDWKWLFIYPQYGIATVNEMAAPADRPIEFRITSSAVMNSFYAPALAGQIYAMPGMETKLHAILGQTGPSEGFSANYSGAGFSGMRFALQGLGDAPFEAWVEGIRARGEALDRARYLELERPSIDDPVRSFAKVDASLYDAIVNMCVEPGKMCLAQMSAIDARGGLGLAGIDNLLPLLYDKDARRGTAFGGEAAAVAALCQLPPAASRSREAARSLSPAPATVNAASGAPVLGVGLPRPSYLPLRLHWSELLPGGRPSNS